MPPYCRFHFPSRYRGTKPTKNVFRPDRTSGLERSPEGYRPNFLSEVTLGTPREWPGMLFPVPKRSDVFFPDDDSLVALRGEVEQVTRGA